MALKQITDEEWLCEYLAKFNGGLDYHSLEPHRQNTYKEMAQEITTHLSPAIERAAMERVSQIIDTYGLKTVSARDDVLERQAKGWEALSELLGKGDKIKKEGE